MTAHWLAEWMIEHEVPLWGVADLQGFPTPVDGGGQRFPFAISFAIPMNPLVMASIRQGPNQAYADEYARANDCIDALTEALAKEIEGRGFRANSLSASKRTGPAHLKGDFPHKTAATRAGLAWIGRHCQLITRSYGPWVRLGTLFTDLALPCGTPMMESFCGRCMRCVEACPAGALTGRPWKAGLPREKLLDAQACEQWKKRHYFSYHKGHICGICTAACPYGLKVLKKKILQPSSPLPPHHPM